MKKDKTKKNTYRLHHKSYKELRRDVGYSVTWNAYSGPTSYKIEVLVNEYSHDNISLKANSSSMTTVLTDNIEFVR